MSYVGDIGASSATATAQNASQNAGTTFNFGGANNRGDSNATEQSATPTATATASKGGMGLTTTQWIIIAAVGVVAIGGFVYYKTHK